LSRVTDWDRFITNLLSLACDIPLENVGINGVFPDTIFFFHLVSYLLFITICKYLLFPLNMKYHFKRNVKLKLNVLFKSAYSLVNFGISFRWGDDILLGLNFAPIEIGEIGLVSSVLPLVILFLYASFSFFNFFLGL